MARLKNRFEGGGEFRLNTRSPVELKPGRVIVMRHYYDPMVTPIEGIPGVRFSMRCHIRAGVLKALIAENHANNDVALFLNKLIGFAQASPKLVQRMKDRVHNYCSWFAIMIHVYDTEPCVYDVDFIRLGAVFGSTCRRDVYLNLRNVVSVHGIILCSSHELDECLFAREDDGYLSTLKNMWFSSLAREVS